MSTTDKSPQMEEWQRQMEALLAFHAVLASVEDITKRHVADTGKYTYSYAGLPDVLEEVKRACELHGLVMTQTPTVNEGMLAVYTKLIHKNGGEVNFDPIMLKMPAEAQPYGSALTYLRRYSLVTIFAIATEDDDGKAATVAAQTSPGRRTEAERMIRESMAQLLPVERTRYVEEFKTAFGCGLSDLPAARHGDALTWSREWMSNLEPESTEQAKAALDAESEAGQPNVPSEG